MWKKTVVLKLVLLLAPAVTLALEVGGRLDGLLNWSGEVHLTDAVTIAPDALLTIAGVGHGLGGIAGLDAKETEAEVPDALEATRRLTFAWLSRSFGIDREAWRNARKALSGAASDLAALAEK